MTCLHCKAETTNGLALCEMCQYAASQWLTYLPIYFRNLARQQRPGRPNGSLGTSGQWLIRRGEVDTSLIPKALGKAVNDLTTWVRCLADDRGIDMPEADTEADTVTACCAFLAEHLTSVATLEWAGQCLRDIDKHHRALLALTETAVPGWYAGACRQITGRSMEGDIFECGTSTYVVPGLTWVTCHSCGATTAARDHLPVILEEASEWLARPHHLARAVVALVDTEQSVVRLRKRINKWGDRGRIKRHQHTTRDHVFDIETETIVVADVPLGYPRYRLGDVLDALAVEGATRLDEPLDAAVG